MKLTREEIEEACSEIKSDFLELAKKVDYVRAGASYHESMLFIALCKKFDIDFIFESGTAAGISTRLWAEAFPEIPVVTVDNLKWEKKVGLDYSEHRAKFKDYPNIEFIVGDSRQVFEGVVGREEAKSVAVFLDGPKDKPALRLAEKLLSDPKVKFVAIDDMGQTKNARRGLHIWKSYSPPATIEKSFHTTEDKWFGKSYSKIDEDFGNTGLAAHGVGYLFRK